MILGVKFTKNLRGFTLIELLVVIAIIGLLSTAIMGPVQTGLKKGRDTRKISDLTQVQGALLQYAGDNNGKYPALLTDLTPTYMAKDTKMMNTAQAIIAGLTSGSAVRDKFMYITYSDLASNIVMYHIGVALENQNASLQEDADCGDFSVAGIIDDSKPLIQIGKPCTSGLTRGMLHNSNYEANSPGRPPATAIDQDFGGEGTQEDANNVCTSKLDTCIFDVIPK